MTKTREKNLWAAMKNGVVELRIARVLQIARIENSAGVSQPDVEGFLKHYGQFWIELKTAARPIRKTTKIRVKYQPGQSRWHKTRWNLGGACHVLIQVGKGHDLARYLIPGDLSPAIEQGVTEEEMSELSVCQPHDDFVTIVKKAASRTG